MDRANARKIAELVTNEQLQNMLETAKEKITDWRKVSNVNKGLTVGASWNVLAKDFNVNAEYHILTKTNLIREFGEFLTDDFGLKKVKSQKQSQLPTHQEPIFKELKDE